MPIYVSRLEKHPYAGDWTSQEISALIGHGLTVETLEMAKNCLVITENPKGLSPYNLLNPTTFCVRRVEFEKRWS